MIQEITAICDKVLTLANAQPLGNINPPQSDLSAAHYHLSVSGVHPTDEQAFDKAYAATDFRHAAADILREVGPRVGSKRDAGTAAAAAAMPAVLPLPEPL
jgi:hypothetical protein